MTSRSPRRATSSMIATTSARPSDATVWMCRSARPRRSAASAIAGLQVGPDREEHGPPLLRRVLDDALERASDRCCRRGGAFTAGALAGDVDALQTTDVTAGARAAHARDVRRRARLDGEEGRTERQARGSAEQLGQGPATG